MNTNKVVLNSNKCFGSIKKVFGNTKFEGWNITTNCRNTLNLSVFPMEQGWFTSE